MEFSKGHGTENDFVILPDPDADLALPAHRVAALCDRRRGLGADGLLRVARAGALAAVGVLPELPEGVGADDWFMDYRNGDGSIAEMCGNGVRVFAHYLRATGLELRDEFVVGSRAGARPVHVHSADHVHGDVTVDMGRVRELGTSTATVGGRVLEGIGIDVGNPHLACVDPDLTRRRSRRSTSRPRPIRPRLLPRGRQHRDPDRACRRGRADARPRAWCGGDPVLRHRHGRGRGGRAARAR